jgi:hypothetical protein
MAFVNRKAVPSLFTWLGATAALLFLASHSGGPRLAAQCGPNPIVCENALTGAPSSEWNVTGAGDATLQGFATDISANKGDTVHFKVTTTAVRFNIDIYRLGYYSGMGARKIASLTNITGQNQAACLIDNTTRLVDCGNWTESATWAVPATAVSGIYIARLVRTDTGGASHVVFVVRDDVSTSDLLMQTSDTTWQAYNAYGGFSLYTGSPQRAFKVSYNRPFATRGQATGLGTSNFVFYTEYPMVRWLEANGYNVSYSSGVDTDRRGALIKNHKVFLSVGHDEYWSAQQRTNVEAARAAGVHLAFVSGNEVYWKTRWEASIDGSTTAYRTLVSYKETHDNQRTDPADPPTWTGTWRDPRFSPPADGRPENSLSGQMSMVNRGSAAISIPSAFAKLRFWRNTAVALLATGQSTTLGPQTLGYEWDEDLDNGSRPAGLMPLSLTSVAVPERLVDFGSTVAAATATHSLTLYRHSSGALVFGAGTVQWVWGLDTNHDTNPDTGPTTPDINMQQATINLLGDMGAQPGTLQAGMFPATPSTDVAAPASTIQSPVSGASFPAESPVTITGTAVDSGGGVVGAVEVSIDGGTTWHRATGRESWSWTWRPGVLGTVNLMSRAVDDSGNLEALKSPTSVIVTQATCPCTVWDAAAVPWQVDVNDASAVEVGVKFRSDISGLISGIRFYKAATNSGAHVGNLWSNSGTLLATANFKGESSSGWQQVTFATPVSITADTTYVASYHTTVGHYSNDAFYFGRSGVDQSPLHALATGVDGGSGVYAYGASAFPSQTYQAANYWVDVVFNPAAPDTTPPTVLSVAPVNGATGVSVAATPAATFSEPMNPATITTSTVVLRNSSNSVVPSTVSYDANTKVVTLDPTQALAASTTFTVTITGGSSGVKDLAGNALASNFVWSFTTGAGTTCPCTIWNASATPAQIATNDSSAVELGVRFRADASGTIAGVRFYKAATNTGSHIGSLWTNSGALLATATFSGESGSGWQQVSFPTPVNITANTTYVASYHTNTGNYGVNAGAFATAGVDNPPLHALATGVDGVTGVYLYGGSAFPTQTFNATNYWVDVVYNTGAPDTTPPTVLSVGPTNGATGVSVSAAPAATFSEAMDASTITTSTVVLRNPSNVVVPSTVSYSANVATLTSTQALAASTTYTATITGGSAGVKDLAGNALASNFVWSFTTGAGITCPCTIWNASATPSRIETGDSSAVELGVRFRADTSGTITGVRYYKGATNTGTHVGNLWSNSGALLATATFSGESASGWQQVNFPAPVNITANTTYVASYHTNTGNYGVNAAAFATAGVDNAPLHALATGVDGANGVYLYGGSAFPTQTFNATNYWVDVVYNTGAPDTTPPTVLSVAPVNGATGVSVTASATATFSEAMNAATITTSTVVLRNPSNGIVASSVTYNASTNVATVTPTQALAASTTFTATITGGSAGVKDVSGNALASNFVWSFTTGAGTTCPCTIWNASATPAQIETSDSSAVELGLRFRADRNGTITGVRFYKAGTNTGTHIGSLWSNTGTLLATATFSGETASGWQQVLFTTPIAVTANTTYVVSYHTDTGNYGFTGGAFTSAGVDNAPLHALATGVDGANGVYRYGATAFPTNAFNATNYWVDVVFQ